MTNAPKPADRARVSHDRCVGVGACVQAAPRSFKLNQAGLAAYHEDADVPMDTLQDAAEACPMSAITVADGWGTR